jgi:hypothetical protein
VTLSTLVLGELPADLAVDFLRLARDLIGGVLIGGLVLFTIPNDTAKDDGTMPNICMSFSTA